MPPAEPAAEWHEIETLLTTPDSDVDSTHRKRRGVRSFAFVAAALVIGGGVLAATLMWTRTDCGAACHVVTADSAAAGKPAETAGLAPASDARMVEGRSAAEPAPGTDDTAAPDSTAAPVPRRHHHHHHHAVEP